MYLYIERERGNKGNLSDTHIYVIHVHVGKNEKSLYQLTITLYSPNGTQATTHSDQNLMPRNGILFIIK